MDKYVEESIKGLALNPKAPGLEGALNALAVNFYGRTRESGFCVKCGREVKAEDFKDAASLREYKISALCQVCQDEVFEEPGEVEIEWEEGDP